MEKKSRKGLVIGLLTPLFVLLLAAGFFFGINRFSIRMELCGPESQTIECGVDTYTEQGARAYFCGSLVFKKGFELEVQTQGAVEESRLGEQTVTYTADFRYLKEGETIVEDVKASPKMAALDPKFLLKEKMFRYFFGFPIKRVYNATDEI